MLTKVPDTMISGLDKTDVGLANVDNTSDANKPISTAQAAVNATKVTGPASAVADTPTVFDGTTGKLVKNITYAAFKTALALVKGDVGLGNVDNTSDADKPISTATEAVFAEAAKRYIEVDVRETRFAGGAPLNMIDDDVPAIQAAIDYAKTLGGRYTGGSVFIRMPGAARHRLDQKINATDAHNITLKGDGLGSTALVGMGNFPIIEALNTSADALYRFSVEDLSIYGPGYTNALAHGIRLGSNHSCRLKVQVWACRRAISVANSWQLIIDEPKLNGLGSVRNYIGLYQEDGDLVGPDFTAESVNCIEVHGGVIQGCENWGYIGENITGSKIFGLEVLGNGVGGVKLGDSTAGHDLKWFTWVGGLIDTNPDNLVVRKGSSALAHGIHFSGKWNGYAHDITPAVGIGVEFDGISDSSFCGDMALAMGRAIYAKDCTRVTMGFTTINDYDRLGVGNEAILIENTTDSYFYAQTTKKEASSPSTTAVLETGTSDRNTVGGHNYDGLVTLIGASSRRVLSGPKVSVNNNVATFDGTTGAVLKDSGKALPSGDVVGTTDTQSLSAKTLTSPTISGTVAGAHGYSGKLVLSGVDNQVSSGSATSGVAFLQFIPTDVGTNKPGMYVQKSTTAAKWNVNITDGSTQGDIDFLVNAIMQNGLNVATLNHTTISTDADATLAATARSVRHTGTLTADRAVTLPAGVTGRRLRITRTGAGAFNLNIGTGPLKALATNTWCEVTYDGSAWYLSAYGAL